MGYLMIFLIILSIPLGYWLSLSCSFEDTSVDFDESNGKNDSFSVASGGKSLNGGEAFVNSINHNGLFIDD